MTDRDADPRSAARHDLAGAAFVFMTLVVATSAVSLAVGSPTEEAASAERVERAMLAQLVGSLVAIGAALAWRSSAPLGGASTVLGTLGRYALFLLLWVPLAIGVTMLWARLGLPREPQPHLAYFTDPSSTASFALVAIGVCVVGPVVEELIFRGLLQTGLDTLIGTRPALALSAALFGLTHVGSGWVLFLPITALGAFFGWLRVRTGGLRAPIVAHVAHNSLTVAVVASTPWLLQAMNQS